MILIEKEKYTLKTWEPEDAESLAEQLNNKKVWDNCRDALPFPYHLENAQAIIEINRRKEGIHDFCIAVGGKAVGNIGFMPESDVQRFNAEVGYILGEPYWNQGIVTEALQDAIRYYFEHTPVVRVFAFVFEHNIASMRVLENAGFTKIGVMKRSVYKNGRFLDAHYYELLDSIKSCTNTYDSI